MIILGAGPIAVEMAQAFGRLGTKVTVVQLLLDRKEKPLGVQILGPQAGDLLGEWVAVMNGGVGLSKIASAIHPYPTLGEINKKVAGAVYAKKIFSDPVRKGLKFFFSFKGRACTCGEDIDCAE